MQFLCPDRWCGLSDHGEGKQNTSSRIEMLHLEVSRMHVGSAELFVSELYKGVPLRMVTFDDQQRCYRRHDSKLAKCKYGFIASSCRQSVYSLSFSSLKNGEFILLSWRQSDWEVLSNNLRTQCLNNRAPKHIWKGVACNLFQT